MRAPTYTLILLLLVAPAGAVRAQQITLSGSVTASGGIASAGAITLFSSTGDAAASRTMDGGAFSIAGGIVAIASSGAAPTIAHAVPAPVGEDETVVISAQVSGVVRRATLHYRRGGEAAYQTVEMTAGENGYAGTLPDSLVDQRGLTYFILVEDDLGRVFRSPALGSYSLQVVVGGEGIARAQPQPAGTSQAAYRLVSFPVQPANPRAEAVLVDDLGPYDPETWRFFALAFDQDYVEFPDVDSLRPGEGYWLITSEEGRVLDTGPGTTTPTNAPFEILLHPRWNLIGAPFAYPVDVAQLRLTSGRPLSLRAVAQGWNDPIRQPVRTLQPFEGYAVFNDLQRVDTLLVFPHPGSGSSVVARSAKTGEQGWTLHLAAETEEARDADNAVGVRPSARDDLDDFDFPEPPSIGGFVSLYFPRDSWSVLTDAFSTDVRAPSDEGHVWDFRVRGETAEVVRLEFEQVEQVPAEWEVWLVDEMLSVATNLRTTSRYQLVSSAGHERSFRLVVGNTEFVAAHTPELSELPRHVKVTDVFPNPFSDAATIRYEVPEPGPVQVRVFNALGQVVTRLQEAEVESAGAQLVVWDGTMQDGMPAASGIYFIHVVAGGQTHTATIVRTR